VRHITGWYQVIVLPEKNDSATLESIYEYILSHVNMTVFTACTLCLLRTHMAKWIFFVEGLKNLTLSYRRPPVYHKDRSLL
jgi:hypothetical protein